MADKYEACFKALLILLDTEGIDFVHKYAQLLQNPIIAVPPCFFDKYTKEIRKHFPPVSEERIEEIADQWWKDHTDWLKDEFRTGHPKDIVKAALRKLAGKGGE